MQEIKLSGDEVVARLLRLSETEPVFILDSCGVGHLGSHLLIAGVRPSETIEVFDADVEATLKRLDEKLSRQQAAIFTLAYDFGKKLQPGSYLKRNHDVVEPDLFLALFDELIVHDYDSGRTFVVGPGARNPSIGEILLNQTSGVADIAINSGVLSPVASSLTRLEYIGAVERIREYIRSGDTYQTNLTQQLRCDLPGQLTAEQIFWSLRRDHPAPFSAFVRRGDSIVVSASPERFFKVDRDGGIEASPIKGTRRRGMNRADDERLRKELLASQKDRAENTMIVDLVRNDLGRVCEFGSVIVEKLCDIEEHPTLFHLVSTVRGSLNPGAKFSEILRAVFPSGSITGAPKIRTMQIIDEIEPVNRGLSMGAIGVYLPPSWDLTPAKLETVFDLSVAIRTMMIRDGRAIFNVGGGVVIDSDPEKEFEESLLKARALLTAIGASYKSA